MRYERPSPFLYSSKRNTIGGISLNRIISLEFAAQTKKERQEKPIK